MHHNLMYTGSIPAGYYHNPISGQLEPSSDNSDIAAYSGGLFAPPNDATEWQAARRQLGPELANAPYGLDAVNPFIGIGHHPVKEM